MLKMFFRSAQLKLLVNGLCLVIPPAIEPNVRHSPDLLYEGRDAASAGQRGLESAHVDHQAVQHVREDRFYPVPVRNHLHVGLFGTQNAGVPFWPRYFRFIAARVLPYAASFLTASWDGQLYIP